MSDEPEIERCVCGAEARMKSVIAADGTLYCVDVYWVRCSAPHLLRQCWVGPLRPTRDEACAEWGTIMRAARERARLQATIHGDHTAIMEEWGDLSIDDIEYKAIEATQEEYEAWANDGWALATEPRRKCPCPDCTEHRARVSAKKETT